MKLTATDRIVLQSILPKTGDMLSLSVVKDVEEKLRFKPNEIEKLGMTFSKEGDVNWNESDPKRPYEIDVSFSPTELGKIEEGITTAEEKRTIHINWFDSIKKMQDLIKAEKEERKKKKEQAKKEED